MLIIGHRGAAGLKPENTFAALRAGIAAGADMLEFDIRLTKDKVPVLSHPLSHELHMFKAHRSVRFISSFTLAELQKITAGSERPIVTLEAALKECAGKVILNIELKQAHCFRQSLPFLKKYIAKKSDWDQFIFSSFSPAELARAREQAPDIHLALLHHLNSFLFLRHMRRLRLSAVGFHRLHINRFALDIAKKLGLFTYAYTVNRPQAATLLAKRGLDGVVTDRPDLIANITNIRNL